MRTISLRGRRVLARCTRSDRVARPPARATPGRMLSPMAMTTAMAWHGMAMAMVRRLLAEVPVSLSQGYQVRDSERADRLQVRIDTSTSQLRGA